MLRETSWRFLNLPVTRACLPSSCVENEDMMESKVVRSLMFIEKEKEIVDCANLDSKQLRACEHSVILQRYHRN